MFEAARDLSFEDEPGPAVRVVGVMIEDLLEGDLAVQLGVQRDKNLPQSSPSVRPQDAEPLTVAGDTSHRHRRAGLGTVVPLGPSRWRAQAADAGVDVGISNRSQAGHDGPRSGDDG